MKNKAQNPSKKQAPVAGRDTSTSAQQVGATFTDFVREVVRTAARELMMEEVVALCGERYRPEVEAAHRRAGSEQGTLHYDGHKEPILRPRVRSADGRQEIRLKTYRQISDVNNHKGLIESMVGEGLGCRGLSRATDGALGKSAIAEQWARKGAQQLVALREVDLKKRQWAVLMVDGVFLNSELCVIVALGVDWEGRKHVLDFEVGATESAATAGRLLGRLAGRGFGPAPGCRLLALCDGSKALQKALKEQWPGKVLLQECLVHVERHILDRLRRCDRSEALRLFKRLRLAHGMDAAVEAYEELRRWLAKRHQGAWQSLGDVKERLLVVHGLELGEDLQRSLLSTNAIENVMRNLRQHMSGVKRWRTEGTMVERWMASGLLWLQKGFHRLRGHRGMGKLLSALKVAEEEGGDGGGKMGSAMAGSSLRSSPAMAEPILQNQDVAETEKEATLTKPAA